MIHQQGQDLSRLLFFGLSRCPETTFLAPLIIIARIVFVAKRNLRSAAAMGSHTDVNQKPGPPRPSRAP